LGYKRGVGMKRITLVQHRRRIPPMLHKTGAHETRCPLESVSEITKKRTALHGKAFAQDVVLVQKIFYACFDLKAFYDLIHGLGIDHSKPFRYADPIRRAVPLRVGFKIRKKT